MWFLDRIIEYLNDAAAAVYAAMQEVNTWIWPFWYLQYPLYALYLAFYNLTWYFGHFNTWARSIQIGIGNILSYWNIWSYFESYFRAAEDAWSWVVNAFGNVWNIIDNWWVITSSIVLSWVDEVKNWALVWLNLLWGQVNELRVMIQDLQGTIPDLSVILEWWANWTGNVIKAVDTWWTGKVLEVQDMINTAFTIRQGFWEGWQDWRDKVAEFFADPLEFLWTRFTNWFLGPEV